MNRISGFRDVGWARAFVTALALGTSGCAFTDQAPVQTRDRASMTALAGCTPVYLFADWDSFAARPMTTNVHRVDINSNYVGTFSDDEFVALQLPAGQYAIELYDYGWFGKLEDRQTWNFSFSGSGQPSFLALTDHSDSLSLAPVSADYGERAVNARKRADISAANSALVSLPIPPPAGM